MIISKVMIENFKSIDELEININQYDNSFTRMLIGVNESGKSNILQALSYFQVPDWQYDFWELSHSKKNDLYIDLRFFLDISDEESYIALVNENIEWELIEFWLSNIEKNIFLKKWKDKFEYDYNVGIDLYTDDILIKRYHIQEVINWVQIEVEKYHVLLWKVRLDERSASWYIESDYEELTEDLFNEYFLEKIIEKIQNSEPKVYFRKPSEEYLLWRHDLHDFKINFNNKPLYNIFLLAGYEKDKILDIIDSIDNDSKRRKLESELKDAINN